MEALTWDFLQARSNQCAWKVSLQKAPSNSWNSIYGKTSGFLNFLFLFFIPHFHWRSVVWAFPEGLPADNSVLWIVEGGFKASNAYQINSGFQGKNYSGLFCACQYGSVRHGFISYELLAGNMVPEASATRMEGFPGPRCPTSSNTSLHFCSRVETNHQVA